MDRLDAFFTTFFETHYSSEIKELISQRATHDDDAFWKLVETRVNQFPIDDILEIIRKEIEQEFEKDPDALNMAKEMANDKALMKERFILEAYVYLSKKAA